MLNELKNEVFVAATEQIEGVIDRIGMVMGRSGEPELLLMLQDDSTLYTVNLSEMTEEQFRFTNLSKLGDQVRITAKSSLLGSAALDAHNFVNVSLYEAWGIAVPELLSHAESQNAASTSILSSSPHVIEPLFDLQAYATYEEAKEALMASLTNEQCVDNDRFAYTDDVAAMQVYEDLKREGCCGSADWLVTIAGREAYIGCNFGH